ncbi:MAG: trehalose-6-phosphate synthase, partial [Candidatus Eisenbacteria bacterium]
MKAFDRIRLASQRALLRARSRAESPPHTRRSDLSQWARENLSHLKVAVVSNRQPYSHVHEQGEIRWYRNAGGLTVALDAVAQAIGCVWVAHGSGDADRETVDGNDRVGCPPDRPTYALRRLWLNDEDHERYYSGFANSGLWPLSHIAYVRPRFELEDWKRYEDVNRRFAEATLAELGDGPALVLLQDYHLTRVARHLRQARPDLKIALFWHIPWPNPEVIRRLPWREEILTGLLANDVLGFHIPYHARNFLETVADSLEAKVDYEHMTVTRNGRRTLVRHNPIGVDPEEIGILAESAETARAMDDLRMELGLGDARVGLGVDRLDYTKCIPERLEALERLYEKYPCWIGHFRFLQLAVPSRIELPEYRAVASRTREIAARINARFAAAGPPLVHLIERSLDFRQLIPLYRMADLCAVTSLHDGMNLVAKEYVAARPDLGGALVLSPFTGAARELDRAWLVSPYDRERLADVYHAALSETSDESCARMRDLR